MRGESTDEPTHPEWLEMLDHTADVGIIVRAPDCRQLFARAAWGLFTVITDPAKVRSRETERIELTASDLPALMRAWLSELNYRHATSHRVFSGFEVRELSDQNLVADVSGEQVDPARHTIYTEVKAVTFHGLKIERTPDGWRAQVIFDL